MRTDDELRKIITAVKTVISREKAADRAEFKTLHDEFWKHIRIDEVRHEGLKIWITVLKGVVGAVAVGAMTLLFNLISKK